MVQEKESGDSHLEKRQIRDTLVVMWSNDGMGFIENNQHQPGIQNIVGQALMLAGATILGYNSQQNPTEVADKVCKLANELIKGN